VTSTPQCGAMTEKKKKSEAHERMENLLKGTRCQRPEPTVNKYAGLPYGLGECVEVWGLESEKGKALNGQNGVIAGYNEETKRFDIRFMGDTVSSLKAFNLRKPRLLKGDCVEVSGLESEGGQSFNGQKGHITGYNEESGCFQVIFDPERRVNLKPENLVRGELTSGDRVQAFGLESESGKALNGQKGILESFVPSASRWQVNFFELDRVVNLKTENLERLPLGVSDAVAVVGLESETGRLLNGQKGIITQHNEETGRFEVRFKVVNLDVANLTKVALAFQVGDCVEVFGLDAENGGKALNGQKGAISTYVKETSMFGVRFGPNKVMNLKADHLRKFGPSPGDRVEVWGLDSDAGRQMNGQQGTVKRYLEEKGRFEVKLGPEEKLVSLKAPNLRKLAEE